MRSPKYWQIEVPPTCIGSIVMTERGNWSRIEWHCSVGYAHVGGIPTIGCMTLIATWLQLFWKSWEFMELGFVDTWPLFRIGSIPQIVACWSQDESSESERFHGGWGEESPEALNWFIWGCYQGSPGALRVSRGLGPPIIRGTEGFWPGITRDHVKYW